jgi:hypothetical protein
MRIWLLILLVGLGFNPKAQSYFNMRYHVNGQWGGGIMSIVNKNSNVYFNSAHVVDNIGLIEQTFYTVKTTNGNGILGATLKFDSTDIYSGSLISYSRGGFYDVLTIDAPTQQYRFRYGVVKYTDYGDTSFLNITVDSSEFFSIYDVVESPDNGIVFTGIIRVKPYNQGGSHDAVLVKTDSLGNEIWRMIYGTSSKIDRGNSVSTTSDGGFIIAGVQGIEGTFDPLEEFRPMLIKTDSLGVIEWQKVYGPIDTLNQPANGVIGTQDGGYVFVGAIGVKNSGAWDAQYPWIVKVDSVGNILWSKVNKEGRSSYIYSEYSDVIELSDGSLVVCGTHIRLNFDTINFQGKYRPMGVIAKYSSQGDSIWSRSYVHPENVQSPWSEHSLRSIVQTDDGGFAAGGWLLPNPPDTGTQDTWVIKVDSFGCLEPGCEVISVPKIQGTIAALKLYPNPAHDILNIEITPSANQHEFVLELYDILGKRVLVQRLQPFQNTVNVGGLSPGVYSYRIGEVWGHVVVN